MRWLPARSLVSRPGTSALAIVALALGIGLTTTMFSIINGVVLRGLPFDQPERIVFVGSYDKKVGGPPAPRGPFRMPEYIELRASQRSFEDIAGFSQATESGDLVGPGGIPMRYEAALLTPNALHVLRVRPLLGRGLTDADAQAGAERVVLIGEMVWATQFQRDPAVVGTVIRVNGAPATIIGVLPAEFGFPEHERVWFPAGIGVDAKQSSGQPQTLELFGRLRDGVSLADANTDLRSIAARLEAAYPENKDRGFGAVNYITRRLPQRIVATFWTMFAAVAGVLLIACVNVANLQLARAAGRTREVAIRLALGATRGRVIRQLLAEGLLLATIGGLGGLLIARIGVALVWLAIKDPTMPFWIRFDVDTTVLLFATSLTAFSAVASSLLPALRVTRAAPDDALKDEGRGSTSLRLGRFSRGLVVAQIALSFGLLMASGLAIKSIVNTSTSSLPIKSDVLLARLDLTGPAYLKDDKDDALTAAVDRIVQKVTSIPGATSVSIGTSIPISRMSAIEIEGQPTQANAAPQSEIYSVAPNYLDVMHIPVVRGRALLPSDRSGRELVAVVSEDFVARYFQHESPIGRRFRIGIARSGSPAPAWRTIVGTVPSLGNLSGAPREFNAAVLVPFDQRLLRSFDVVVASAIGTTVSADSVRRAVAAVDDNVVVDRVATIAARYGERVWGYRAFGGLFSTFGIAALILAGAGLYGVMAFAVQRRTAEIGIRMALGADQTRILKMILRQGTVLLAIGVAIGAGLGMVLSAQLTQIFYQVDASDPSVLLTTFAVLAGSGLVASFVPARRAARVDPLVALRK